MENDCGEWLMTFHPQERSMWRTDVRSAMFAASQLPGRGPTGCCMPLHQVLHVNQKSDYDEPNAHGELLFPRVKMT